jgi:hypothetical protein
MSGHFLTSNEENIIAQLWIAFGRGACQLPVSASAVERLLEAYEGRWQEMINAWPDQAADVILAAERLGQKCVEVARTDHRMIIEPPDVDAAREFVICPCGGPDVAQS